MMSPGEQLTDWISHKGWAPKCSCIEWNIGARVRDGSRMKMKMCIARRGVCGRGDECGGGKDHFKGVRYAKFFFSNSLRRKNCVQANRQDKGSMLTEGSTHCHVVRSGLDSERNASLATVFEKLDFMFLSWPRKGYYSHLDSKRQTHVIHWVSTLVRNSNDVNTFGRSLHRLTYKYQ
jgi:hypothetical protein